MTTGCGHQPDCTCGCCAGVERLTPVPTANRPGLSHLTYRVGTHASFFETMQAQLAATGPDGTPGPLARLLTREPDDASLALLDAWATVADVLTFYQERIANEGYLRTAVERRSVVELARLIGYQPRPGVAATTYLAFTMQDGAAVEVPQGTRAQSVPGPGELPQSFETTDPLPTRGEWNVLHARQTAPSVISNVNDVHRLYLAGTATGLSPGDFLVLVGDKSALARVRTVAADADRGWTVVTLTNIAVAAGGPVTGTSRDAGLALLEDILLGLRPAVSGVKANQAATRTWELLSRLGLAATTTGPGPLRDAIENEYLPEVRRELAAANAVRLRQWLETVVTHLEQARDELATTVAGAVPVAAAKPSAAGGAGPVTPFDLARQLLTPPSTPPPSPQRLGGDVGQRFATGSDATFRVLTALEPVLADTLLPAWEVTSTAGARVEVYALRVTAGLFGKDVPRPFIPNTPQENWNEWTIARDEDGQRLFLDAAYPAVKTGDDWIVIERPPSAQIASAATSTTIAPLLLPVAAATTRPRSAYGLNGARTTVVELSTAWWNPTSKGGSDDFDVIRETNVHTGSELLALADAPLSAQFPEGGGDKRRIPLDGLYSGLEPGRWLIAAGDRVLRDERQGIPGAIVATVPAVELVMLAGVEHATDATIPGDTPHTTLILAEPLGYEYQRESFVVHANVAKATHGETHVEVLGSGDSAADGQHFPLTYAPLTYVSSAEPSGATSTLEVRVNGVRWPLRDDLLALGPADRGYTARADADLVTTVHFGDGHNGARVPTGLDNIEARYRSQIGAPGNVGAGRISVLATTPEGARAVVNPVPATGGADPESRDQARAYAPLTITALDRLVSVRDYEDFARTFAGIGKALAVRSSDRRRGVHVTVAGADDAPLTAQTDTFVNLRRALHALGDPGLPVQLEIRELLLLVVDAAIGVLPDYRFDLVEPKVRAALFSGFGFANRELGQDVYSSEVISAIQAVEGVAYVDLNKLGVTSADPTGIGGLSGLGEPKPRIDVYPPVRHAAAGTASERAQLAVLSPKVPETVLLREAP